jgi:hypothetical protein
MSADGCLKVLLFLVLLPVVFSLPPLGFAFVAYTMYFYRKG